MIVKVCYEMISTWNSFGGGKNYYVGCVSPENAKKLEQHFYRNGNFQGGYSTTSNSSG
jgi:hypothetical protein